jgi:hypothetical protein
MTPCPLAHATASAAKGLFNRAVRAASALPLTRWLPSTEAKPNRAEELRHLTSSEMEVYTGLRVNKWGMHLRLEQERLPWSACLSALQEALHCGSNYR